MVPFTVALFLTLLLSPIVDWTAYRANRFLRRVWKKWDKPYKDEESSLAVVFSVLVVVLVFVLLLGGFYLIVRGQVSMISSRGDDIMNQVVNPIHDWIASATFLGESGEELLANVQTSIQSLWQVIPGAAGPILSGLLSFVMILFLTMFLLVGRRRLSDRLEKELPGNSFKRVQGITHGVEHNARTYILTKILTSFITGMGIFLVLLIWLPAGDALLWGFVYFIMNMIPIYGSIIAGLLVVLWTLSTKGLGSWPVIIAIVAINNLVSNGIEPKLMSFRLPVGPVTVLLGIILWGWMWGGIGLFLAVPIMIAIKVLIEETQGTCFLSILMEA
jgi:predicted PurR-regulated permease PerM